MEELRSPPTGRARRRQIKCKRVRCAPAGARAEAGGAQAAVVAVPKDEADSPCRGPRLLCLQLPPGLSPGSQRQRALLGRKGRKEKGRRGGRGCSFRKLPAVLFRMRGGAGVLHAPGLDRDGHRAGPRYTTGEGTAWLTGDRAGCW